MTSCGIDFETYFIGKSSGNISDLIANFAHLNEGAKIEARIVPLKLRPEFADQVVLCYYEKIVARKQTIGYNVHLSMVRTCESQLPISLSACPAVQISYNLQFNRYVLGDGTAGKDTRAATNMDSAWASRCASIMEAEDSTPGNDDSAKGGLKGYYKQVHSQMLTYGVDPNSIQLWKTVWLLRR